MFLWLKYIILLAFGLLLFACSHPAQHTKTESQTANKTERSQATLHELSAREIANNSSLQSDKNTAQLIYRTEQKKNTSRLVNSNLQNIAPRNAALQNESKAIRFPIENPSILDMPDENSKWALRIIFDNDIWDNTDYYYTNGVAVELLTPLAKNSPVNKILLGTKAADIELNGFSIRQNMYTPTNPDVSEILINDRPFSAFLTIGHFRETYHIQKKLHIKSALDIGVLGPASLGGTIQTGLHTEEPVGWQNQIQNSFVINYFVSIEKGILQTPGFEFNVRGSATVGTLFNKAGGGFTLRLGRFIPVYRGPVKLLSTSVKSKPLQFWFFAKGNTNFVLYDATLQGGLFNTKNPYTISSQQLNRLVFRASAGIAVYLGSFGIELENFYLSPEFKGGRSFGWGRIKLIAAF
jgi:hypothetical protein